MPDTQPKAVAAASDPWGTPPAAQTPEEGGPASANPWGGSSPSDASPDWLTPDNVPVHHDFDIWHPFGDAVIPLQSWVETALEWLVVHFRPVFQAIRLPVDATLSTIELGLRITPAPIFIVIFALLAWQLSSVRLAIGSVMSLIFIGLIGAWDAAMITLSLVMTSVVFCVIIGLPIGIGLARSDRASAVVRPVLDAMQTTPAFVYLIPIVMLFGIGNVPGVVATIIFALPPLVRLTNLGIRQVPADLIEASRSFGANPRQLLFKVQLPLAMPTIMAGLNQTLMLALSMVVIASMIGVGGLGQMVLRGIGRLDMGLATVGGVGIVILAILLDRMTQALGVETRARASRHWYDNGPVGFVRRLIKVA
ncbi:MAG: glycine betaine/L-proline ABC transporter permease ProW [Alphaproteobacteria bacterium]